MTVHHPFTFMSGVFGLWIDCSQAFPDSWCMGQGTFYDSTRWRALRLAVLRRDGYRCLMAEGCETPADTVDHIIPIMHGGSAFDPANLRGSCRHHNFSAGAAEGNKHRVPVDETPAFHWLTAMP